MTEQRIELGLSATTPSGGGCGDACGCGHGARSSASAATEPAAEGTTVLRVEGMTCDHCVRAVTEELNALEGVDVIDVDLRVGGASVVRIASTGSAGDDDLSAAIDEAGYTLDR